MKVGIIMEIKTMFQGFEWNLPADGKHWNRIASMAEELADLGFTDVWLPPAYKCMNGKNDVGYAVYDLYDIGEFPSKNSVETKYGTVGQYMDAIASLHLEGIDVLADIVLNHRMGADDVETVTAHVFENDKRETGYKETREISAETVFTFKKRNRRYSGKKKNAEHFTGTDVDRNEGSEPGEYVYLFDGHHWSGRVSGRHQNYDYLMGCDLDFNNPVVVEELTKWGRWYVSRFGIDGVRLDAVKHIDYKFYPGWLRTMREYFKEIGYPCDFMAVGEYIPDYDGELVEYLNNCGKCMNLFDFVLQRNLRDASERGSDYDLRKIFDGTLVKEEPWYAVTFVTNHDTQPGQMLESWVHEWFRQSAHALILLRQCGLPCVFYGDLYGLYPYEKEGKMHDGIGPVKGIRKMLEARDKYAIGKQADYFKSKNLIGWTREGGVAVVISNAGEDAIRMRHGTPGQVFVDILGNAKKEVVVEDDGCAWFGVSAGSVSIWVPKE